jgi:hypothetical protein
MLQSLMDSRKAISNDQWAVINDSLLLLVIETATAALFGAKKTTNNRHLLQQQPLSLSQVIFMVFTLILSSVVLGAVGLYLYSHVRRLRRLAKVSPGLAAQGSVQATYNQQYEDYDKAQEHAAEVSSMFYDLVTDFYTYGWGLSFHFAPRFVENFPAKT